MPTATKNLKSRQPSEALLTDLYQLTMLEGYVGADMLDTAVFEFFTRRLPGNRNFLMAAGLEQLLDYLENLRFEPAEIEFLDSTGRFSMKLLDYLGEFRFRGEVRALPEGTLFFANEPVVQVIASLPEAQVIETRLINLVHFQSLIASKAARIVLAAPGKDLIDFGFRRAHGAEAGLFAARASYLAGFAGTATVQAAADFGVPIYGTMAHSFIQSHASESEAFEHFARTYPDGAVLLIDTYDTVAAARMVTELVAKLRPEGIRVSGVRLDSGDMVALSKEVRKILDSNGCEDVLIFCSGSLDEYKLARDFASAPVDGFGIGTHLDVSADAPYFDCVYKIEEYAGEPRRKKSAGKATWPGRKQVYRRYDGDGFIAGDALVESAEACEGRALLDAVMRDGGRLSPSPDLGAVREHAARELESLPEAMRDPFTKTDYSVDISDKLKAMAEEIDRAT